MVVETEGLYPWFLSDLIIRKNGLAPENVTGTSKGSYSGKVPYELGWKKHPEMRPDVEVSDLYYTKKGKSTRSC